jgi:hypothetical protein
LSLKKSNRMRLLRDSLYSLGLTLLLVGFIGSSAHVAAQVRSSSNYQLESDSINTGGGLSNSASFTTESTVGEIATGRSDSATFSLLAGYQQLSEAFVSLSVAGAVVMAPDLPGLTGGFSTGSTTFTVITDSPTGYVATLAAEGNPALQSVSGATIANYNNGATADFTFTIPPTGAVFGFSPEGSDVAAQFLDNGTTCGVSTTDTSNACWAGASTSAVTIVESTSPNQPVGATTTLRFQVGIASGAGVESGVYTATTTITALPL